MGFQKDSYKALGLLELSVVKLKAKESLGAITGRAINANQITEKIDVNK